MTKAGRTQFQKARFVQVRIGKGETQNPAWQLVEADRSKISSFGRNRNQTESLTTTSAETEAETER